MTRVSRLLRQEASCHWLFYGDSITHGARHTGNIRDYTQLFAERVRFSEGRGQDVVINTALSNYTTRDLLAGFENRVARFSPQVVFLMIGMNDCANRQVPLGEYKENLYLLANRIEDLGALPVLQTTSPLVSGHVPNREPHFPAYMDTVRAVAVERNLPIVDHTAHWLAQIPFPIGWMSDAFHPNAAGHEAMYLHLWQCLTRDRT